MSLPESRLKQNNHHCTLFSCISVHPPPTPEHANCLLLAISGQPGQELKITENSAIVGLSRCPHSNSF